MQETISVEVYRDEYGERLGLKYRYNPDTNQVLKDGLGFPKFKWEKEKKLWSIQNYKNVIEDACDLIESRGYDTELMRQYSGTLPENQQNKSDCWTKMKRTRLYLHWPYLADADLRESVRLAVRSISGRKFHADEKCWSIPAAQARTLYGVLKDTYPPLAEAVINNEDVEKEVVDSIARVEISGASSLNDSKLSSPKD